MTARRPVPISILILALVLALLAAGVPAPTEAQTRSDAPTGRSEAPAGRSEAPAGQMTWAVHISLAPIWFDPAEHTGIISVMMVLTAVHDAMVKPMPGKPFAPSLAESWTTSKDGLVYEFVVRKGVVFHNGDSLTADDVKFSFDRYRGAAARLLKEKVAAVEVVDPYRVRFRLKEPWPDFMTFYGSPASGAGWIVPKKYVEKVGDEGFKKAPVGAGPYKLASFNPGIEIVLEAHDRYWRKTPAVKRLVWRTVTEDLTRLAMLKRGEVDVAYSLRGPLGEEVKKTPGLKLVGLVGNATQWLNFGAQQWDPKSPWHDKRVRLAAALAFDKDGINQAETLGFSKPTGSIIPSAYEYALAIPAYPYDPARAKKLLAEAGYPNGFETEYMIDVIFLSFQLPRNAATRVENYLLRDGLYSFGGYPDMDDLFVQQARELDPKRREALLHQIQKLAHERVMAAPLWELGFLNGVGPRVEESGLGLIALHPYSAPYEDLRLKK